MQNNCLTVEGKEEVGGGGAIIAILSSSWNFNVASFQTSFISLTTSSLAF